MKRNREDNKNERISSERDSKWGKVSKSNVKKVNANFSVTGALNEDKNSGKVYKGIVLKWSEPKDACLPKATSLWKLFEFKGNKQNNEIDLSGQSAYLFGREDKIADVYLRNSTISKQHAVIQFRLHKSSQEVKPYILDIDSSYGTFLNGESVPVSRYVELKPKDVITFGRSKREFVVMNAELQS